MLKPTIPQGTRDFGPELVHRRHYIFRVIRETFELYGFQPLETPAMENLETLLGKYGEEGDKLIFKILNNGLDRPEKQESSRQAFEKVLAGKNVSSITERALRYDLTIPFARYVAMNHNQLNFPFRRYQIQPVWRADKPQRGRYREFYQCDADIVGSKSLWNEVDLSNLYHTVFTRLGLSDYELRINSRKILTALAEKSGDINQLIPITVAIDKLDKIGIEKVKEELLSRNIAEAQINLIESYLQIEGTNHEKLNKIRDLLGDTASGQEGIQELDFLLSRFADTAESSPRIIIDFSLARGLNYYTGIIFEAKAPATVKIGSIGGGGRYDDLTGLFGVKGIPGVGISFGGDRIYDEQEELKLIPAELAGSTRVLFFNLGENESAVAYHSMQQLRAKGIASEMYHENAKFDKQFKYAERKNIPFAAIIGSRELEEQTCVVKDMRTGNQEKVTLKSLENLLFI